MQLCLCATVVSLSGQIILHFSDFGGRCVPKQVCYTNSFHNTTRNPQLQLMWSPKEKGKVECHIISGPHLSRLDTCCGRLQLPSAFFTDECKVAQGIRNRSLPLSASEYRKSSCLMSRSIGNGVIVFPLPDSNATSICTRTPEKRLVGV